ncbi:MAG: hypothetical protein GXY77_03775, partial [Fibrobacter sp.]|nr:hypothetical protein [Fibrobacter sp.]
MYKIDSCFKNLFCSRYGKFAGFASVLIKALTFSFICCFSEILSQDTKPVIGVLGLDNSSGGISDNMTSAICDSISSLIEQSDNYL